MAKLKPEDLEKISQKMRKMTILREGTNQARITVHMGTCGIAAGARQIMAAILTLIEEENTRNVVVTSSGCAGLCSREPMMTVELKGEAPVKYVDLSEKKVQEIFAQHVMNGNIVVKYALAMGSERVS
ncbi:hypothetical protein LCGC14_1568680 [marine sediment metagenome]|uniref:NADP oxidoreductase n=1 Tax=marine sediment metagenome TaxID=412755 RepID=A0A0F9IKC2_9ZZZZ